VPNLPLAFAELLVGGIVLEAALKGAGIADVVKGTATASPISGLTPNDTSSGGNTGAGTAAAGTSNVGGTSNAGAGSTTAAPASLTAAPAAVQKAWARATSVASLGAPYNNGAGHSAAFTQGLAALKAEGTDCSGFVSTVLGPLGAGVLTSAGTTQTIYNSTGISDGAGKWITIYDRHTGAVDNEHVIMSIAGQFFESGGQLGKGPTTMTEAQARQELAGGGFQVYHPAGD
jgi:hypothetical protein